jgi:hypothetical protein
MAAPKRAAIDDDGLEDRPLSELSAADFLTALNQRGLVGHLVVWPEKKKVELYLEPENLSKLNLGRLVDILRGEKKKRELEPWGPWIDRGDPFLSSQPAFGNLVQTLEQRLSAIERRLGG